MLESAESLVLGWFLLLHSVSTAEQTSRAMFIVAYIQGRIEGELLQCSMDISC